MADITSGSADEIGRRGGALPGQDHRRREQPGLVGCPTAPGIAIDDPLIGVVELLFFAYRDFTGEADVVLAQYGFGRAHHRVLHFVNRRPGLRVADLLDILRITKQSLARVLKQLVDREFILQEAGAEDRRERRLYLTAQGKALAVRLAELQTARIRSALDAAGPQSETVARAFLQGMIGQGMIGPQAGADKSFGSGDAEDE